MFSDKSITKGSEDGRSLGLSSLHTKICAGPLETPAKPFRILAIQQQQIWLNIPDKMSLWAITNAKEGRDGRLQPGKYSF